MSLSNGETQQLENLCRIFDINVGMTQDDPVTALVTLQNLYSMPVVEEHFERHRYGHAVLNTAGSGFDKWSPFVGKVGSHVIMMQEYPHFYANLSRSSVELADTFESLLSIAFWLRLMGIGVGISGLTKGMADGLAEGIKKASVREGIERAVRRLSGQGALHEALSIRLGSRFAFATGVIGAALVVGGTIAYFSAIEQMEQIQEIMLHRYQSGDVSADIYGRVLTEIDPSRISKYWQL